MPQEGVRSAVYRSFITCDNPKGDVECGAIRKQKSRRTEHKMETEKGKEKIEMPRRISEDNSLSNPSSLQLLRVSRGVQKLNNVIESWSKGISYEGQSKDIAQDLLRGALDLEESLVMLGRIQEASEYMSNLKQKEKIRKHEKVRADQMRIQRSLSDRFLERNHEQSLKPRISADGSSRDCYEELRKVIKDSFIRQNLLGDTVKEKNRFCRSSVASSSEIASTSSSHSSTSVHGNDSDYTKSSLSSATPPKNYAKGPNLIAKLMGLEEFPSNPTKSTTHEIGKQETKKLPLMARKEDAEQMKTKEILETMHFEGVIRSNSVKDIVSHSSESQRYNIWHPGKRLIDDARPIVLIKPLCVPHPDTEDESRGKTPSIRKPRVQMEIHPKVIDQRKEAEGKEAKIKHMAFGNAKASSVVTNQRPRKVKPDKVEKAPNPTIISKRLVQNTYRSSDRVLKSDPMKTKKRDDKETDNAKNKALNERGSGLNFSEQKRKRIKKGKPVSKPTITEKRLHGEDEKGNDLTFENYSVSSHNSSESANQVLQKEETTDFSELQIQDYCNNGGGSPVYATTGNSEDKKGSETSTDCKSCGTGINLKSFLLNSPAFLTYTKEFFDLDTNITTSSVPCSNKSSFTIPNQRLSLDCAKELIKHKRLLNSQVRRLQRANFRICISLDQLLVEVVDGFEALRSQRKFFSDENCLTDSIFMMVEKDLKDCNNNKPASGIWDLDWGNGFYDDTEKVESDVGKLILSELMEEIFS